MSLIQKLTMPKWGLSMAEGKVVAWLVEEGARIETGAEVLDVETDKIAAAVESPVTGVLRRKVAKEGEVLPVGGLLGVIADPSVPDAEIDAYVAEFQASFVPSSEDEAGAGPAPEKVQVQGRNIRYLKRGDGPEAVVLIHGFGGDLNNWLFNHEALAAKRSVYALDLPGHGESTKDVGSGTPDELADGVAAFLDAMGVERTHLVGHSLGGLVALLLARSKPDRVRSLTLICSAGLGSEINADYVAGFIEARGRGDLKPHLQKLFADPALVTRQLIDDILKFKRLDGVDAALRRVADRAFPNGRQAIVLRESLARPALPVLVIWGAEDQILPAAHAANLPGNARVYVIPAQGHMVQMEAAPEVNRLVQEFWDSKP